MFIGVQYYRPPFPEKKYWEEDLKKIKDNGIDVIQLWVCWGWVEPEPGKFNFEDYDFLIENSIKRNLKIVLSTIAEIQPFWIERLVPDGVMIDHLGRKVKSITRKECIVGITPGGCTDHPYVREYMINFLKETGKRYGKTEEVIGWDIWNETRWNVHSEGYVCYCSETLRKFREYLKNKYGDLNQLNRIWKRRYISWEDVNPGRTPGKGCTELIEFLNFLTYRASEIMKFRANALREVGVKGILSAHCAAPSILSTGWEWEQPLCRGNDWDFLEFLDGYGCSHFPFWGKFDDRIFGIRVEAVKSANQGKILWISELQGGSARDGLSVNLPVEPNSQQRWIWNGFSRGAKGVIFWCWRDEVFGHESGGFGIAGNDGFAEKRLKYLKETSGILKINNELFDKYKPIFPSVGVLFEMNNYFLEWALTGKIEKSIQSLLGYLRVLEDLNIPYEIVESRHTKVLTNLKFLIMPFPLVISDKLSNEILEFLKRGGVILTEGDLGAYDELSFYRYPGKERKLAYELGISPTLERQIIEDEEFCVNIDGKSFKLKSLWWISPLLGKNILGKDKKGRVVAIENNYGLGKIYAFGTFLGARYKNDFDFDINFKDFIRYLLEKHDCLPEIKPIEKDCEIIYRYGYSGENILLFIINPSDREIIEFEIPERLSKKDLYDLKENKRFEIKKNKIKLKIKPFSFSIFLFK